MPNVKSTKALQKRSDASVDSFTKYYASIWGEQRWQESLFPALSQPTRYCALLNRFGSVPKTEDIAPSHIGNGPEVFDVSTSYLETASRTTQPFVLQCPAGRTYAPPFRVKSSEVDKQLLSHWNLDLASVLAASMLQVQPGDRVLDLCAAPGGKTLVLAQALWPSLHFDAAPDVRDTSDTCLHSNEFDHTRYKRLASNLESYLPAKLHVDQAVKVVRVDGSKKGAANELPLGEGGYDRVLLDAPCSSERHIIHAHLKASSAGQVCDEMMNWKSSHSKTLAKTQALLLMTALRAAKIGGRIVYATCSIATEENDDVIERTLEAVKRERKKHADTSRDLWKIKFSEEDNPTLLDSMTERTKYGRIALPDHPAGGNWGPLYFCVMQKEGHQSG